MGAGEVGRCAEVKLSSLGVACLFLATSCGAPKDPVECWEGQGEGHWERVDYPGGYVGGEPGVSDGRTFQLVLGHPACESCDISVLDEEELVWKTVSTSGLDIEFNADRLAMSSDFLGASNFVNVNDRRVPLRTFATLDRKTRQWSTSEPPEEYEVRWEYELHWTGREFLIWGGYVAPGGEFVFEDDTPLTSFSDGAMYDPTTGDWTLLPPAWPPGEHTYGKNNPRGQMSSVPIPEGLFVWGARPDEAGSVLGIFDRESETWRYPDVGGSPDPRRFHQLFFHNGDVYLIGGFRIDYQWSNRDFPPQGPRELWRFSLDDEEWEKLEVPDYADLEVAKGDWIGDRLVLLGHQCENGSAFNATDGTWEPISGEGHPPTSANLVSSVGDLAVAGSTLVVNAVSSDGAFEDLAVWTFRF